MKDLRLPALRRTQERPILTPLFARNRQERKVYSGREIFEVAIGPPFVLIKAHFYLLVQRAAWRSTGEQDSGAEIEQTRLMRFREEWRRERGFRSKTLGLAGINHRKWLTATLFRKIKVAESMIRCVPSSSPSSSFLILADREQEQSLTLHVPQQK